MLEKFYPIHMSNENGLIMLKYFGLISGTRHISTIGLSVQAVGTQSKQNNM